jgi:hypothetical protein
MNIFGQDFGPSTNLITQPPKIMNFILSKIFWHDADPLVRDNIMVTKPFTEIAVQQRTLHNQQFLFLNPQNKILS